MISSQWDEIKDGENNEKSEDIAGTGGENVNIEEIIGNEEVVNNEEIINIRNDNQEIENATE